MKLRTHHLIQRSLRTRFRFLWKNPPHFQIQTQTLIQFRIPNLRCDFGPGIHLLHWPLGWHLQQYVIFGRISGSSRDLKNTLNYKSNSFAFQTCNQKYRSQLSILSSFRVLLCNDRKILSTFHQWLGYLSSCSQPSHWWEVLKIFRSLHKRTRKLDKINNWERYFW